MKLLDKIVVYGCASIALSAIIISALDDYTRLFQDIF